MRVWTSHDGGCCRHLTDPTTHMHTSWSCPGFVFNILSFLPIRWIFFVFASLMVAAFFIFIYVARRYRRPVRQSPALPGLSSDRTRDGADEGRGSPPRNGAAAVGPRANSAPTQGAGRAAAGLGRGAQAGASKYQQLGDDEA